MGEAFIVRKGGGIDTSDATAIAAHILTDDTAYVNGVKLTGSMANVGSQTAAITTKAQAVVPTQGYHNGSGSVSIHADEQAKIISENIVSGVTILDVPGSAVAGNNDDAISLINRSVTNAAAERLLVGVATIGYAAFNKCLSLTKVAIASGVTEIGNQAFANCTNLLKIWIPASCVTISTAVNSFSPFIACPNGLVIYCEAASKPAGWGLYYNYNGGMNLTVNYNTTLEAFNAL